MPQRQRYLFVCINRREDDHPKGSCTARGSEEVRLALKEQLAARGLAKLEARVCVSSCLDQCSSGVCILVEPDHFFYGRVTVADVPEIVEGIASGQRVERLVLSSVDLARGWRIIRHPSVSFVLLHLSVEQRFQQVPMAMLLILGAMAEQRYRLALRQMLKEAQGEFLAVILDSLIAEIDRPALAQFLTVTVAVFRPGDLSSQEFIPKLLARPEIRHPDMVAIFRQAAAPASRGQDPQTILL
jgi:(2Fe-2S) ferredoxin